MPKRDVEAIVRRIGLLRDVTHAEALPELRKALADRVNLIVAKAAKVAAERQMRELIPDLLAAFDRMFVKPVESDTQCWGKNAIAKALTDLDYRESAPYLRGRVHIQMEGVWGGAEDTAPTLRGICVLGLASCNDITRARTLRLLVDSMNDDAAVVRAEAVRAVAEMDGEEASLLLRLKAGLGDKEASVTGQAFDCLLRLECDAALGFVSEFLNTDRAISEAVQEEAALALGSSRLSGAVEILINTLNGVRDRHLRATLFRALSASRQERALEFLLEVVRRNERFDAESALEALKLHKDSTEIQAALDKALQERHEPFGGAN